MSSCVLCLSVSAYTNPHISWVHISPVMHTERTYTHTHTHTDSCRQSPQTDRQANTQHQYKHTCFHRQTQTHDIHTHTYTHTQCQREREREREGHKGVRFPHRRKDDWDPEEDGGEADVEAGVLHIVVDAFSKHLTHPLHVWSITAQTHRRVWWPLHCLIPYTSYIYIYICAHMHMNIVYMNLLI